MPGEASATLWKNSRRPVLTEKKKLGLVLTLVCRRHLIRLWLRDEELHWDTPAALQSRWDRVYGNVTAENQVFPLEPSIRSASSGIKAKKDALPLSSAAVAISA